MKKEYFRLKIPALIRNNVSCVFESGLGKTRFLPLFQDSKILKSALSSKELEYLKQKIGVTGWIALDLVYILTHALMGGTCFVLFAVIAILGFKMWKLRHRVMKNKRPSGAPNIASFVKLRQNN